jgi:hypothetical protein
VIVVRNSNDNDDGNNNNNNNNNAAASDMDTINSSNKIPATFYCLGTWFVSGIYV